MAVKKDVKTVLLLLPQKLESGKSMVTSLHIEKDNGKINYNEEDLDRPHVAKCYGTLPKQVKEVLEGFGSEAIWHVRDGIRERHAKQTQISLQEFRKTEMMRYLHKLMDKCRLQGDALKWYHRMQLKDGSVKTAPCVVHKQKPLLSIDVVKSNSGLTLQMNCTVSGNVFSLNDCSQFEFLLEKEAVYFLLSYKDYEMLQWVKSLELENYGKDEQSFSANVLSVLEKDYKINRNGLFKKAEIDVLPVSQVVLTELNNEFLVFTPRWRYDEWIEEGAWSETSLHSQDGVAVAVKRNAAAEEMLHNLIKSFHPEFLTQQNGNYIISFKEAKHKHWFLKTYHKLLEEDVDIIGMDMLRNFHYSRHKISTSKLIVRQDESTVTLQLKISFGKESIPLHVMQKLLLSGQRALFLKDESMGILDDEWLAQYASIIKHGKVQKDEITVAKWLAVTEQNIQEDQRVLNTTIKEEWWQKMLSWQNGENIYSLPAMVNAELRPYQHKGYEWMRLLAEIGAGSCLADDMGLGKTLQTICLLAHYVEQYPAWKHIIICPASLMYNWQHEIKKFAPSVKVSIHHGSSRIHDVRKTLSQVIITSYGTMRSDLDMLAAIEYGVAVVDESHNIKNPSAQITKAIQEVKAVVRIALSGTPVVNNTFDLYAQLNFILPGMFGSREFFKREYANAIDKENDEDKVKALRKMTSPFILRRTKEQVAKDLPEKTEMILWCDMEQTQRDQYNQVKEQVKNSIFLDIQQKGLAESKLAVIQGMLKLRQVCNSPLLLPAGERISADSVKTDMLMDELGGLLTAHKVLVFSQFSSMLDLLAEECKKQDISFYHFDGQTLPAKRAEMVSDFQDENNKVSLFLISLKAGNTGLTLTAADYVFIFDPWWNTAVQDQAIDRTHRIGQTRNVFAYKMACRDTIEEKILLLQDKKKKLSEDLVASEEGFVKQLTEEDVAYLFA